jgi:hypothetical protein
VDNLVKDIISLEMADWWTFITVLGIPVLGGIVAWLWKLDTRIFALSASMPTREEFTQQMTELRHEIAELRRTLGH